jgi:cytochrome c oxidase subunit 2
LEGIFGRGVQLADGGTVVADETYLRESILRPNAQIVAGYQAVMPTYLGQIGEQGILQIIAYLKTLAPPPAIQNPPGKIENRQGDREP